MERERLIGEMYCEKCSRIIETDRCPVCRSRRVREAVPGDICFLTEQDYVSSGILEDVLKQSGIPFLKKEAMGAGLSIKVGPMLDRSRFYVPYEQLNSAMSVVDEVFAPFLEESGEENEAAKVPEE